MCKKGICQWWSKSNTFLFETACTFGNISFDRYFLRLRQQWRGSPAASEVLCQWRFRLVFIWRRGRRQSSWDGGEATWPQGGSPGPGVRPNLPRATVGVKQEFTAGRIDQWEQQVKSCQFEKFKEEKKLFFQKLAPASIRQRKCSCSLIRHRPDKYNYWPHLFTHPIYLDAAWSAQGLILSDHPIFN